MDLSIIHQCSKCGLELKAKKLFQKAIVIEVEPCENCMKKAKEQGARESFSAHTEIIKKCLIS